MITATNLIVILRDMIGETAASVADSELASAINAALLAVYGDLVVVCEPVAIDVTTGTNEYDVPDDFLYIQGVWDSSGARIPDYAWEIRAGVAGGTEEPQIIFNPPFFTPVTGQDPKIAGWQAKTVEPAAGGAPSTYTAVVTAAGDVADIIHIDTGWLISAALSALHSGHGGTASDLSDWHKMEAADSRLDQKAERRLKDELMPTIPPKYRPTPGSRIVPGRAE